MLIVLPCENGCKLRKGERKCRLCGYWQGIILKKHRNKKYIKTK